jgi:protein SCO1
MLHGATPAGLRDRFHDAISAAVARPIAWIIVVAVVAAWPIAWALRTPLPPRLPVLGTVEPFQLIAQDGAPFGSKDLAGRVWLANLMFTRCETVCPAVTRRLAKIQSRTRNLEPDFHLVSITVDPEFDRPERLAEYARAHRASPRMWTFLTGPADAVRAATARGLRVSTGRDAEQGGETGTAHATQLVLVDRAGQIRGYYDAQESDAVDRIVRDAAVLVNRG